MSASRKGAELFILALPFDADMRRKVAWRIASWELRTPIFGWAGQFPPDAPIAGVLSGSALVFGGPDKDLM